MPDTTWPVSGPPPGSSRADLLHPDFDATLLSNDTSTAIPETEDCAPSFRSPPDASRAPFPHRSPRRSSANAACGGLKPPTAGRLRRAKPSSPAQHRVKKLYLQTELLSTFVAHVRSQTRCPRAGLRPGDGGFVSHGVHRTSSHRRVQFSWCVRPCRSGTSGGMRASLRLLRCVANNCTPTQSDFNAIEFRLGGSSGGSVTPRAS